ncbi:metallophosphoesterase family protein [Yinghuangia seranimata]|uniref:metallophosphoesterase family protein n=1 Tax=Yinghuangia seranimata TaxID=408067 RepID=UPI00248D3795|nr:metallophosphoesterase [Yinghuangia seranimata]MDI2126400.1 metallophosphoesterase family protein [Yinghuangia seranimata]
MRILLAGDTHGNLGHLRLLLDVAAEAGADRIFQLGDFGYWEHEPAGVRFLDELHRSARSRGVTVYFLDGNHDKTGLLLERYGDRADTEGFLAVRGRVRYAPRGHHWTWDGTTFLAFGGALSLDKDWRLAEEERRHKKAARKEGFRQAAGRPPGDVADFAGTLWFPEEEATDAETDAVLAAARTALPDGVDVLLTHDKPRATKPEFNRKDDERCFPNQDRVQALVDALHPDLVAHGHLHYRYTEQLPGGPGLDPVQVEGLAADPQVSWDVPGYRVADSWLVLEVEPDDPDPTPDGTGSAPSSATG